MKLKDLTDRAYSVIPQYRFYEKVLNVKADVAAILNSFFPAAVVSALIRPSAADNARFTDAGSSRGLRMR
jgi:hypothetical protein